VLNKFDLVAGSAEEPLSLSVLDQLDVSQFSRVITTSATKGWGLPDLRDAIEAEVGVVQVEEEFEDAADLIGNEV